MIRHSDSDLLRAAVDNLQHTNDPLLAVALGLALGCLFALFV